MDQIGALHGATQQYFVDGLSQFENRHNLFTDYAIQYGDTIWRVHRVIVATHSPVLREACSAAHQDDKSQLYTITFGTEACVQALIDFFYDFDYIAPPPDTGTTLRNNLTFHTYMAVIAESLEMPHLVDLASTKFDEALHQQRHRKGGPDLERIAYASLFAHDIDRGTKKIRNSIVEFLASNTEVLQQVGSSEGGRNPLKAAVQQNWRLAREIIRESQRRTDVVMAALNM